MNRTNFVYGIMSRMDINEGLIPICINSQIRITDDEVTLIDTHPNPHLMPSWEEGKVQVKTPLPDHLATAVLLVTKKSDPDKNISMVSIMPESEIAINTEENGHAGDYVVKCIEEGGKNISIQYDPRVVVVMIIATPSDKDNYEKNFENDLLKGIVDLADPEEEHEQEAAYLEGLTHKVNALYDIALSNQEVLKVYHRILPDHYGVEIPMDFIIQVNQVLCSLFSTVSSLLKFADLDFIPPIEAGEYLYPMDIDESMILDVYSSKYKIIDTAKDKSYSGIFAVFTKLFEETNNVLDEISDILKDPSNDTLYFIDETRSSIEVTIKAINGYQSVISTKED